eukprot:1374284-Amorphochlora_amoeboformis.AAC.1
MAVIEQVLLLYQRCARGLSLVSACTRDMRLIRRVFPFTNDKPPVDFRTTPLRSTAHLPIATAEYIPKAKIA